MSEEAVQFKGSVELSRNTQAVSSVKFLFRGASDIKDLASAAIVGSGYIRHFPSARRAPSEMMKSVLWEMITTIAYTQHQSLTNQVADAGPVYISGQTTSFTVLIVSSYFMLPGVKACNVLDDKGLGRNG